MTPKGIVFSVVRRGLSGGALGLSDNTLVELDVKVIPRASRSEVAGTMADGALKVKVTAVPEKGKANAEVCEVLAKHFGVGASQVEIVAGATSTRKRVRVLGR